MGILDAIQADIGRVFAHVYLDGTLHKATLADDGKGAFGASFAEHDVKGLVDTFSEAYRARMGIPLTDAKLIVLQSGVAAAPTVDDEITLRGTRWRVLSVEQDPARGAWTMRGTPTKSPVS